MFLDANGPVGIEVKPTTSPKPQLNSMIRSEHHHNQNPHAYAHSNQMFKSNLPIKF
jgi:hypothetical protein